VQGVDERKGLVAAGYDDVADQYAALERPGKEWPRLRLLRGLLARLQPSSTVLDLGCGNGIPALREIVCLHEGIGVDLSATQVALARMNVPRAKLIHGDALGLDFAPGSFDGVVAFYLLDHIPREEHARLLEKAWQWLAPGGLLLFSVEPEDEPANVTEWLGKPMFFSHFDAETTLGLVRDGGFEVLDSHREVQVEGEKDVEFLWVLAKRGDRPALPLS
jgi:SAM-dependent methyltransferase